jgi:hypothetical protein
MTDRHAVESVTGMARNTQLTEVSQGSDDDIVTTS